MTVDCNLIHGDCLRLLSSIQKGSVDLVFADPPFNIGRDYSTVNEAGWDDSMSAAAYAKFTQSWLAASVAVLRPGGSLWINAPDAVVPVVLRTATATRLDVAMRNWCVWHYRFGQHTSAKFISTKTHLLHFILKGGCPTWNPNAVLEPSYRASKYGDARTRTKKNGTPGKRVPFDVWYGEGFARIQGNNKERRPLHDNQLPEALLHRIIAACTNAGDLVLDPFLGSGTTGVVAKAMGRRFIGIEYSKSLLESAASRILEAGPTRWLQGMQAGVPALSTQAEGVARDGVDLNEGGPPQ